VYPGGAEKLIKDKFSFVSTNASNMSTQLVEATVESRNIETVKYLGGSLDNTLVIVDEAHNLFRAITNGTKNATEFYKLAMKANHNKMVFLTGTPVVNDPYELIPCFNMLVNSGPKNTLFPEDYDVFRKYFVKNGRINNKSKFQNRIFGLVSYVTHTSTPGINAANPPTNGNNVHFPERRPTELEYVEMTEHQYAAYTLAKDSELEMEKRRRKMSEGKGGMSKPKSEGASTFKIGSRQLSNYAPPMEMISVRGIPKQVNPYLLNDKDVTGPKFIRILKNVEKNVGQSVVYSQFTGTGGLGTFQRFLELHGWRIHELQKPIRKELADDDEQPVDPEGVVNENVEVDVANKIEVIDNIDSSVTGAGEKLNYIHRIGTRMKNAKHYQPRRYNDKWSSFLDDVYYNDVILKEPSANDLFVVRQKFANIYKKQLIDANFYVIKYNKGIIGIMTKDGHKFIDLDPENIFNVDPDEVNDIITNIRETLTGAQKEEMTEEVRKKKIRLKQSSTHEKVSKSGGSSKGKVFAIITGAVALDMREQIVREFSGTSNINGELINLLLISASGAEGLDLKHANYIHIMEPYWVDSRHEQVIARILRNNSHVDLPVERQFVVPYFYFSVQPRSVAGEDSIDVVKTLETSSLLLKTGSPLLTTDLELYFNGKYSYPLTGDFVTGIQEVSIECLLNQRQDNPPHCKLCMATDATLYHEDFEADMRMPDPCIPVIRKNVMATEFKLGDKVYYYRSDNSLHKYSVYKMDDTGKYVKMPDNPEFFDVIEAIEDSLKSKTGSGKKTRRGKKVL
jgi:hypothetical protein